MLIRWLGRSVWIVLVTGALLMGGCNVFEVSQSEPETIEALLADARAALATGKAARAVRLLERAYQKDSTDVRVRVELGNALYSQRGLDLFALRRAAEHLLNGPDSSGASGTKAVGIEGQGTVCTDEARPEASPNRYRAISLNADPLRPLTERQSLIQRVRRLVVTGVLDRRASALSEADVRVQRKGLLVGAVTVTVDAVDALHEVFVSTGSRLFFDQEAQPSGALLACADTEEALEQDHEAVCALSAAARRAVQWLRERNRRSGGEQEAVLIERLRALADAGSARVGCS